MKLLSRLIFGTPAGSGKPSQVVQPPICLERLQACMGGYFDEILLFYHPDGSQRQDGRQ
jgi:hypothetical protein